MSTLEIAENEMMRRGKLAETLIMSERPDLLNLYLTYQNEAINARRLLDINLKDMRVGAEILEVGGGILALAIQLASEGFKITTVEPVADGFSGISYIMKVFLEISKSENLNLNLVTSSIEECEFQTKFEFIFSINVMEHLKDPYSVLQQLVNVLNLDGKYRFICPNYDFPYEPHFGKWLFSRKNNAFYLRESRANSILISSDRTLGLFHSLNFLTLRKITRSTRNNGIKIEPNTSALYEILERSNHDSQLQERHSGISKVVKIIFMLKLNSFAKIVPANFQPIMDVEASSSRN